MADLTGGTPPTGASPFRPPEDYKAVYDHFGGPGMFSVANAAALPASGNWPGRTLVARNTGMIWVNPSGNTEWVLGAVRPIGSTPPTIIQQGRAAVTTTADGMFDVTFPTPFPGNCDRVLATSASPGTYYGGVAIVGSIATKFTARIGLNGAPLEIDWIAVGR